MTTAIDGPALGWRRVRALRASCGIPCAAQELLPAAPSPAVAAPWSGSAANSSTGTATAPATAPDMALLPAISGGFPITPPIGLAVSGVPRMWIDVLAWAGVPLARDGGLHWGRDVREGEVSVPTRAGGMVILPAAARLLSLNGIQLKPLRMLVAERLGYRLQAGPGVHLFAWEALAVVISCRELPLGGLLSGPRPGSRATVSLPPGGAQVVRW